MSKRMRSCGVRCRSENREEEAGKQEVGEYFHKKSTGSDKERRQHMGHIGESSKKDNLG